MGRTMGDGEGGERARGVLVGWISARRLTFDGIVEFVVKAKVVRELSPHHELFQEVVDALGSRGVLLLEGDGFYGAPLRGELAEVKVRAQIAQSCKRQTEHRGPKVSAIAAGRGGRENFGNGGTHLRECLGCS